MMILLLFGILVAMGWVMQRNATPSKSVGCGCSIPATTEVPVKADAGADQQDDAVISKSSTGLPRLLDFGSTTCMPCKMMAPILDELAKTYKGKLAVEFINVTKDPEAATEYGVRAIPTQVLIDKNGREFFRHAGFYSKDDILAAFEKQGIHFQKERNK